MAIPFLQALVGLIFVWAGIEMANHPPTKNWQRWSYRLGFVFLGVVLLVLTRIQYKQEQSKEADSARAFQSVSNQQINLELIFKTKFDTLQSNQFAFQKEQQDIQMKMAENPSYDPALRERIIASHEKFLELNSQTDDMNSWLDGLRGKMRDRNASIKIQHDKLVSENLSKYQKIFKYFDYAINSFTNMLGKEAILKNDEIVPNLHDLPLVINPDKPEIIGDIKFQKNPDWHFQIVLDGSSPDPNTMSTLRITGAGSFFEINANGSSVMRLPEMPDYSFSGLSISMDEYKTKVNEAFGYLIIYLNDKSSSTNK